METAVLRKIDDNKKRSAVLAVMGFIGMGTLGVTSSAAPVVLAVVMATRYVLQLYAGKNELQVSLQSIYNDMQRIERLYSVIYRNAQISGKVLDDKEFKKYSEKILKYILLIVPPQSIRDIRSGRPVEATGTIMSRLGTFFSPADYIQILMNDFTRLTSSFSILYIEYNPNNLTRQMGGEKMGGEQMAGEQMAGEKMGGEKMAGEQMAGEKMAGEQMGGQETLVKDQNVLESANELLMSVSEGLTVEMSSDSIGKILLDAKYLATNESLNEIESDPNPLAIANAAVKLGLITPQEAKQAIRQNKTSIVPPPAIGGTRKIRAKKYLR